MPLISNSRDNENEFKTFNYVGYVDTNEETFTFPFEADKITVENNGKNTIQITSVTPAVNILPTISYSLVNVKNIKIKSLNNTGTFQIVGYKEVFNEEDFSDYGFSDQGFVYNAGIGLRRWRAALAKVKAGTNQIINVSAIGDSITEGANAGAAPADYLTKGYLGRVRTALASKYGDVGTGFIPIYYPYGAPFWTFTGSWTDDSTFGVTHKSKKSSTNGDTATLSFNGTGIGIVVARGSGAGTFSVSIDGGASTPFDSYSVSLSTGYAFEVTGLSAGEHTLVLTSTVTGGKGLWLLGAYPIKGTSGVRIHEVGKYATKVSDHTLNYSMPLAIDFWSPPLTIIAIGANDYTMGTPIDTYKSQVKILIDRAKQFGDVLLVSTGLRTDSGSIPQSEYVKTLKNLALETNSAFVDIFSRWSGDATYAKNTLGFISDTVHPNDYGHQDIATAILNVLLEER